MVLKRKVKYEEYKSVPCPKDEHPIVWGNPHVKTGKILERTERVMSKEAHKKRIQALEFEWQKTVEQHKVFIAKQKEIMKKAKTVKQLIAEGCFVDPTETDEWFY